MRIEGRVGVARYADDQEGPPRLGNQGEVVIGHLNPTYHEQTMRGNGFIYSVPAAGAALAALGVNTAPFIWNPAGNTKLLLITKVAVGLVSVTATAGHVVYGSASNLGSVIGAAGAPVTAFTHVAPVNGQIGGPAPGSAMRFAPTTITLAAAPSFLATMGGGQATAATGATSPYQFVDEVAGRIQVWPGSGFCVAASATISTYCVTIYGLEVPLPLTA